MRISICGMTAAGVLLLGLGCNPAANGSGSNTNWLGLCGDDSACGGGLRCLCGMCSRSCREDSDCGGLRGSALCAAPSRWVCDEAVVASVCAAACVTDAECAAFGPSIRCRSGICRELAEDSSPDAAADSSAGRQEGGAGLNPGQEGGAGLNPGQEGGAGLNSGQDGGAGLNPGQEGGAGSPESSLRDVASDAQPSCTSLPRLPTVLGCAQPSAGWPDVSARVHSAQFVGKIAAIKAGGDANGCLSTILSADRDPDRASAVSLTVLRTTDAGDEPWNVEYEIPGSSFSWTVGKPVFVEYGRDTGETEWSPVVSSLSVNFGQAFDVWVAEAGSVDTLPTGPVGTRAGSASCITEGTCGTWGDLDLGVQTGADTWAMVPRGETVAVEGYRITNGGIAQVIAVTGTCMDWTVNDARVAAVRVMP